LLRLDFPPDFLLPPELLALALALALAELPPALAPAALAEAPPAVVLVLLELVVVVVVVVVVLVVLEEELAEPAPAPPAEVYTEDASALVCSVLAEAAALPAEAIRDCGASGRKAQYILEAARQFAEGRLDPAALASLPDEAVCAQLQTLPGVGRWTAEMLLLFSLQRPDVLSFGDFGIRRGLRMLYRHRELTPALFQRYRRRFSPYGSTASLYLWAVAGGALPELTDPAPKK